MQPVALAVVDRDPVAVHLGHPVGAAGVEGRGLALGDLLDLAEHLRRAGLVEADRRVDDADRVEHPGHRQRGRLAGEHRLAPRGLDEGLGGQVVDLGRPVLAQHRDERRLVEQVPADERDLVLDVGDPLEADRARPPHHADDLVALLEQELGQVRPVLTGHAGDQRSLRAIAANGSSTPAEPPRPGHDRAGALQCALVPIAALRLVPPRRHRRRVDRGGEVALRPSSELGFEVRHGGRRGPGRPPGPRPGHRRPTSRPTAAEVERALERGRRRGRREPVLAPAQPGRGRAWSRRPARGRPAVLHHHDLAVAAAAARPRTQPPTTRRGAT